MNTNTTTQDGDRSKYASIIIDVPEDEYHQATRDGTFLSSHMLAEYRDSPLIYHKKMTGAIPQPDSQAFLIGRAAHCLILEGPAAFASRFLVSDGPVNPKTNEPYGRYTKTYAEWAEQQAKPIISAEDYQQIMRMRDAVAAHKGASVLLSEGRPESVVRTVYGGTPCQIRIDWFSEWHGIVDLKTCDDLDHFRSLALYCYRYQYQLAFYRSVLTAAGGDIVPVHIIAVEKKEPFRVGVWVLDPDMLSERAEENEAAIARLLDSMETDTWPSGYEETLVLTDR